MDGVLYFLRGQKHAEHFLVSYWSLRKHWRGAVCVVTGDRDAERLVEQLGRDSSQPFVTRQIDCVEAAHGGTYATKTLLPAITPYDRTLFLDADTVVLGPIDAMFPDEHEVVLTQFADWTTKGSKMRGRIEKWRDVAPDDVDRALAAAWPAINTGVLAWTGDGGQFAQQWRKMTMRNVGFICDEIAAQLVFPRFPRRIMEDDYNCSPIYSTEETRARARIMHGHGQKFFKSAWGWQFWEPHFREACDGLRCLRTRAEHENINDRLAEMLRR